MEIVGLHERLKKEREMLTKCQADAGRAATYHDVPYSEEQFQEKVSFEGNKWTELLSAAFKKQLDKMKDKNAK